MNKFNVLVRKIAYNIAAECIEKNMFIALRNRCRYIMSRNRTPHFFGDYHEATDLYNWVDTRIKEEFAKADDEPDKCQMDTVSKDIRDFTLHALMCVYYPFVYGDNLCVNYPLSKARRIPNEQTGEDELHLPILGESLMVVIPGNQIKEAAECVAVGVVPKRSADTGLVEELGIVYGFINSANV